MGTKTKQAEGYYEITAICKDDLGRSFENNKEALKRIDAMDEAEMTHLASKLADAYLNQGFWEDLRFFLRSIT